jgi:signal peptidase I
VLCAAVLLTACSSGNRDRTFVVQAQNMVPSLQLGDRLLVQPGKPVTRGAVVIVQVQAPAAPSFSISLPGQPTLPTPPIGPIKVVQRVVGLPGEIVEGRGGAVVIDGKPLAEPYLPTGALTQSFPAVTLGSGQYWVMGDNRMNSYDSRFYGPITASQVIGVAITDTSPSGRTKRL